MRPGYQEVAHAHAHLGGPVGGRGVAGVCRERPHGGGQSSVELGDEARVHGERLGWWRWVSWEDLSMFQCLDTSGGGCGHDGIEASGEELTAPAARRVRGRK